MIVLAVTYAWDVPRNVPEIVYSESVNTWDADIQYLYN